MTTQYRELLTIPYDRKKALEYAHMWAKGRNPAFLDFENYGGDCTNYASQVIFAGSGIMNYTPGIGWFYLNSSSRSPSWTGVDYLYNFLVGNDGAGPFGELVDIVDVMPGDLVQLGFTQDKNHFNHTPVIVSTGFPPGIYNILVAAHTDDQDYYPLTGYNRVNIRYIHIKGARKWAI